MAGLLRYMREHPWTYSCLLFIVLGVFTLTRHGQGHTLFWAGILLCAAGVLVAVVGYFLQRPKGDRSTRTP
jgi:drug/metabolite transporter (DMT)-like permease